MLNRHHLPFVTTHRIAIVLCLLLTAFCLVPSVFGQAANATLSGEVIDRNGAVVPAATVTVINVGTNLRRQATTNDSGVFTVPLLPAAIYTVRVEHAGFTTALIENVVLNVGDQKSLQIQMKVGEVSETVNITGETPLINESPAVGTVVDRAQVENMPLNGRSFQSLITLTPGVVVAASNTATAAGQFSANGQRTYSNYFTVDGVSANFGVTSSASNGSGFGGAQPALTAQGTTQGLVSVDALQEFRIQTSNYAPEFGRSPGAQVQLLTRSGTNDFHGTAFDYLRNDVFDANDWFANSLGQRKAPERQNDFGGVINGPIVLPRFGEGGHQPGYNGRNRTFFFFSYEGLRLRQPQFAITTVPSLTTRQTAASAFRPLLNAFPKPTGPDLLGTNGLPTGLAQFADGHSDPSTLNATSLRIDHTFNSKFSLFGRYANTKSSTATRTLAQLSTTESNSQSATVGGTLTLTNNLINEIRFNFSRARASGIFTIDDFGGALPLPDSVLFPAFASSRTGEFIFTLSLSGGSPIFNVGTSAANLQRQINLVDSLSVTHGAHNMKFGADYRRLYPVFGPLSYLESILNTSTASLVAGTTNPLIRSALSNVKPVFVNWSFFGQDSWRLARRLTLTYGLRWELNPTPHNSNGPDPSVVTGLESLATFALAPAGTPLYKARHNNFAPRVGASYQLREKQRWETVIRGGVGVFYDLGNSQTTAGFTGFPYVATRSLSNVPYPLTDSQLAPPALSLTPPYNGNFFVLPNFNLPFTVQWNFGAEQALGANQTVTASYVGNFGRRNLRQQSFLRPNSSFGSVVILFPGDSTSDYDALQVQFQRRFSHGLQILSSYTWAHAIDDLSIEIGSNSANSRGNSNFDVRHNFSASVSYNITGPKGSKLARGIFGNWGLDGIVHAQTGTPVDITALTVVIGGETITRRPDLIAGVPIYLNDPTVPGGRRFNSAAFATPSAGRQGTLGRNVLRGLPLSQLDLALRRVFSLTERVKLEFRAEGFNILNHPNFGAIRTTSTVPSTFGTPSQMAGRSLGGLSPIYQIGGPRSFQFALKLAF